MGGRAQNASGLAELIQARVENFKRVTDTSGVPVNRVGYSVILGSKRLDTSNFCFSISLVTDTAEFDQIFRNYFYVLDGAPVLLYLNHPSMLYLVKELGAREINTANLQEVRSMLPDFPLFLGSQPHQICCSKDGVLSGEIVFTAHEHMPEVVKPEGIPLKYPESFPAYKVIH